MIGFVIAIYIALAAYVGISAFMRSTPDAGINRLWLWVCLWSVPIGLGAAALIVEASMGHGKATTNSTSLLHAWALQSRWIVLMMAIAPLAVLSMFIVARTLVHQPLVGADPASWFRRVGFEVSYGVPLVLVALTFIGFAIRDRSSALAFAAGPLFNVVATMIVLVRIARGGGALDAIAWITVGQVNAIVSSIVALIWQASIVGHRKKVRTPLSMRSAEADAARPVSLKPSNLLAALSARWPLLLVSQVLVTAILVAAFLAPAAIRLATVWSPPSALLNWVSAAGGPAGWLALALSVAAAAWLLWGQRIGQALVAIFAAVLASIIALTVLRQSGDHEQAFHALMAGSCLAAWLLPFGTWAVNRLLFHTTPSDPANSSWAEWPARTFGVITVGLALWEYSAVASWWVVLAIAAIGRGTWSSPGAKDAAGRCGSLLC